MKIAAAIFLMVLIAVPSVSYAHYEGELLPDSVAVMEYRMIISMTPNDTLTRNKLGMVYVRQNKLDKAKEQFLAILDYEPADFDALDSLGIVSELEGNYEQAAAWFAKALETKDDAGARKRLDSVKEKLTKKEPGRTN